MQCVIQWHSLRLHARPKSYDAHGEVIDGTDWRGKGVCNTP